MILVTGAAGFIGSNVVARLNAQGRSDIVVSDWLGESDKWRNLQKQQITDIIRPEHVNQWLNGRRLSAVIHMGANSSTTATDGDDIVEKNLRCSIDLLDWCAEHAVPFIYASSAATYGGGEEGFVDDWTVKGLKRLRPLNLYGWSKHVFDQIVASRFARSEALPPRWAGLKFFNVFGPNEYHKGDMMSVLAKAFETARRGETVTLFKSHRPGVDDGDQKRDFIYVDDVVDIILWFLEKGEPGIYNAGTGVARSFRELIEALFHSLDQQPKIRYVDMPESIRDKYQYFTQASTDQLRRSGYEAQFTSLEAAVDEYVRRYLNTTDRFR